MDNDAKRIGIYINDGLLKTIDTAITRTNATSRSEFISEALQFYLAWLDEKNITDVLTPALESVIGAKILDTEERLARVIFKQSVELAMLTHIIASSNNIQTDVLDDLRKMCVENVKRLSGKYKLSDIVRYQKE